MPVPMQKLLRLVPPPMMVVVGCISPGAATMAATTDIVVVLAVAAAAAAVAVTRSSVDVAGTFDAIATIYAEVLVPTRRRRRSDPVGGVVGAAAGALSYGQSSSPRRSPADVGFVDE
jgi:hypothetical protein